jgi:hypothetical protein
MYKSMILMALVAVGLGGLLGWPPGAGQEVTTA